MKSNKFILSLALMVAVTLASRESIASNDTPAECANVYNTNFFYDSWGADYIMGLYFSSGRRVLQVKLSEGIYTVNLDSGGIILRSPEKNDRAGTDRYNGFFKKTVFERLKSRLADFREGVEKKAAKGISRLPRGSLEDPIPVRSRAYYGFPALDCADAMIQYLIHHFPGKYQTK